MAKFEDTPEHVRRRRWDPVLKQMVSTDPPRPAQLKLIVKLCDDLKTPVSFVGTPADVGEATRIIQELRVKLGLPADRTPEERAAAQKKRRRRPRRR